LESILLVRLLILVNSLLNPKFSPSFIIDTNSALAILA
jgi:hypothetical protein